MAAKKPKKKPAARKSKPQGRKYPPAKKGNDFIRPDDAAISKGE
jgi:hypothetical protein